MRGGRLASVAPWAFIFVWASGYIAAKYGLPYAEPLTFLSLRYAAVIVLMLVLSTVGRAPWPSDRRTIGHIAVAGILIQAGYLGGVWCAIRLGMPAGVAALIVNTQPILTGLLSPSVGESVSRRQWAGLVLGFVGVTLVVSNRIVAFSLPPAALALCLFALGTMTVGVLYQKRNCPSFDPRSGQVIQFAASLVVTLPFALLLENNQISWTSSFWFALAWSVFVLSGIGISLLFLMIRTGTVTTVTSYFYLAPPLTALMAWLAFGETLSLVGWIGMAITLVGVALVVRQPRS